MEYGCGEVELDLFIKKINNYQGKKQTLQYQRYKTEILGRFSGEVIENRVNYKAGRSKQKYNFFAFILPLLVFYPVVKILV